MFVSACGGGGGGSTPTPVPLDIVITPDGGDPIATNGAGLLPENINGSAGQRKKLGDINDNKNADGEAIYDLAPPAHQKDNTDFQIDGNALYYIGTNSGYFEATGTQQIYTLAIYRYDNLAHYQSRNEEGAKQPQIFIYTLNLQNELELPEQPEGLHLRPVDDAGNPENVRVYSEGESITDPDIFNFDTLDFGALPANADGSTNPVAVGILDYDDVLAAFGITAPPADVLGAYNVDGVAGDDIIIEIIYRLADNPGAGYSHNVFDIVGNNELVFTGANSGDYDDNPHPTYTLSIVTALNVRIELSASFVGRIDADASNDTEDADTREFTFAGGALSNVDVAATANDDAHRIISVAAGNIWVRDVEASTGKLIRFDATTLRLPADAEIYQYHIIVDSAGKVSAVAELPIGTEFYVLGTGEELMVPESITFRELKFTDKDGGVASYDIKIKYALKSGSDDMPEIAVDGSTISIVVGLSDTYKELLDALNGNSEVTALVNVEAGSVYAAGRSLINGNLVQAHLSGGADAVPDGAAATKAQIEIGGLIIKAANAGAGGNNIFFAPRHTNAVDSAVTFTVNGNRIDVLYGDMATLADLITAIDGDPNDPAKNGHASANALVDFDTSGITQATLDSTLLVNVFFATHSFAEDDNSRTLKTSTETPDPNVTGDAQNGPYTWQDDLALEPEDFTINIGPDIL